MSKKENQDFESALIKLEERVKALEEGNLPLEDAVRVFEEGMKIAGFCSSKLHEAEQRVEVLLKQADGEFKTEPFSSIDEFDDQSG